MHACQQFRELFKREGYRICSKGELCNLMQSLKLSHDFILPKVLYCVCISTALHLGSMTDDRMINTRVTKLFSIEAII
ncbi:unnamed protein product [Paramecium octaurelia]|uniref:Uncharacterized protein n=1 Tax=Paramecium octaurelia TaxID=43137 RepID=A0A8S1YSJ5_PAROT|nr:unnamed protein product [Paramecium octaurelia]